MSFIRASNALPVVLLLLSLTFSPNAFANGGTVGCAGATGTFDYSSLQAALDAAHAVSNRNVLITVSGTCTESVTASDFENLQINGTPGATLSAPSTANFVLIISLSKNVVVQGITFQGAGPQGATLAPVSDSMSVTFDQCTFQNASTGIFLNEGSLVHLTAATLQNNNMGARISGSEMTVGAPGGGPQSYFQNNGVGIQVDENAQMDVWSGTTIQNNGEGIIVNGGRLRFCCGGNIQVLNNLFGLDVDYGSMDMLGPVTVQGNTIIGILLRGSSANISGGQVVQQNGNGSPLGGGIVALGNSHLGLFDTQVINNSGDGIVLRDNSSGQLSGNTITGNSGNGITLFVLSSLSIDGTHPNGIIASNGGLPVACSFHSFAYEDGPKIKKLCVDID